MTMNDYSVKKAKYYPGVPNWLGKVYMPVSMNNGLFQSPTSTTEIVKWIDSKTSNCTILIGDYLHRHNIFISGVTDQKQAIDIAKEYGKGIAENIENASKAYPNLKLEYVSTEEFNKMETFVNKLTYYHETYLRNLKFRRSIDAMTFTFMNRQAHVKFNDVNRNHCKNYLLEELVIFELLAEQEYLINIYPGQQLKVFKDIVSGGFRNLFPVLQKVSLVELKMKPLKHI